MRMIYRDDIDLPQVEIDHDPRKWSFSKHWRAERENVM